MLKSMVRPAAPVNGISVMVRMLVTTTVWLSPFFDEVVGVGFDVEAPRHVGVVNVDGDDCAGQHERRVVLGRLCFGDGVFAFESLDFGFAGFECGGCGGIAAGGEAVGAVAEGHEFQRRFVVGALGDGEFRAGELLAFGVDLA